MRKSNYDKFPTVSVRGHESAVSVGWAAIRERLSDRLAELSQPRIVLALECYSGVVKQDFRENLMPLHADVTWHSTEDETFMASSDIERLVAQDLGGSDPIFGRYTNLNLSDFLDSTKVAALRRAIDAVSFGLVIICGPGALLCCDPDIVIYADMPRWEEQMRQRRGLTGNLGIKNAGTKASLIYKRSFFVDWRVCDRLKKATMERWDYLLDTTDTATPKLVGGAALRDGLRRTALRPFRVVPFFDPGPWGGQWMKEVCGLDQSAPNYAWCFDCVPEENSLVLNFGSSRIEIPAQNLIYYQPEQVLGTAVYGRFGAEFPIRFDFLDTMGGGNLSFQVHPLLDYARQHFGLPYTQDESYYLLDATEDACVYLGTRAGTEPSQMMKSLCNAQGDGPPFDDAKFVAKWPARKHDHFLIPAGTVHCSGAGSMVLEVSHTPYIFTFKLWDWGRLGLDGIPRPINLERGKEVICWERDENWVRRNLINRIEPLGQGAGWREERTGLYESQFIETRRYWFTATTPHDTKGNLHVLNLVEGEEAVVESPTEAFEPFVIHYAETFIVPASVGAYQIRPSDNSSGQELATLKAYVRVSG